MRSFGLITALLVSACGAPELKMPKPLEVVFLPEDGIINVQLAVRPRIYFSAAVDPESITAESVRLESASLSGDKCDESWKTVTTRPEVETGKPQVVKVVPIAPTEPPTESLVSATCYELIITTEVRGTELAPLPDIGVPGRPNIGALCHFRTQ